MTLAQKRAHLQTVASTYAEVCADCEELRVAENTPANREAWQGAWMIRQGLLFELMKAAMALSSRPTKPPETTDVRR